MEMNESTLGKVNINEKKETKRKGGVGQVLASAFFRTVHVVGRPM